MKDYFKRLKNHAGLSMAFLLTIMMFGAAASNKNIHSITGVLVLGAIGSFVIWAIVLLTNFKK